MKTIKIGCWNINQRAGSRNTLIPSLVFEEIMKKELHVLAFTEFYETTNSKELVSNLNNAGYTVKMSEYELNSNQILVAIKNELVNTDIDVHCFNNNDTLPNLLHLRINDLNIIGTRIKIGPYSNNQEILNHDFVDRRNQLYKLIDYASNLEGQIIILGDFNNGKHCDKDIDKTFKGLARQYFNYYLMKDDFEVNEFLIHTPTDKESYSWRGNSNKNKCKLDHIITKNISVIENLAYDWSFVNRSDYKMKIGYPDHAILTATIKI